MRLVEGGKAVDVPPIKVSVTAAVSWLYRHLACGTQQCKMGEVPATSDWLAGGTNVTFSNNLNREEANSAEIISRTSCETTTQVYYNLICHFYSPYSTSHAERILRVYTTAKLGHLSSCPVVFRSKFTIALCFTEPHFRQARAMHSRKRRPLCGPLVTAKREPTAVINTPGDLRS
jgi:hypothetical protein